MCNTSEQSQSKSQWTNFLWQQLLHFIRVALMHFAKLRGEAFSNLILTLIFTAS
jgi:hypothetical protein